MRTVLLKNEEIYRGDLILVNRAYGYREQCQELSHVGVWNGEEKIGRASCRERV